MAWLKANAYPLATATPGSGFQDLEPLRAVLGKARIVSLGEATHGTREFFQLKHRLIEYCIVELGFTIIGLESNYGSTLAVNDYVLGGSGNVEDVAAGLGIWDTEEVRVLIEWVRAWNRAHEYKVCFYGCDMQDSVAPTLDLLAYLERVAPELAAMSERDLAPFVSRYTDDVQLWPGALQERVLARIAAVLAAFDAERMRWSEQTGEPEWHLARQSAVVLDQYMRAARIGESNPTQSFAVRDRAMADNVRALLDAEGPEAKAVLWAHNAHTQRSPFVGRPNMGSFLHAAYGAEHVTIGFAFNRGGFRAWSVTDGNTWIGAQAVGPAPDNFVDAVLAATGIPLFALDLARVPADGPVAAWMASKPMQRTIGAVFLPEHELKYAFPADPRDNFDLLLFVECTSAARNQSARASGLPAAPVFVTDANDEPANLALMGDQAIPEFWHPTNASRSPFVIALMDETSPTGGRAVRIERARTQLPWGQAALTQSFAAAPWRGKRLAFSAALRAEGSRIGTGAQLVVNVWPKRKAGSDQWAGKPVLALQADGPVRSPDWVHRSVAVDIPADADRIQISLVVSGNTCAWFGDLAVANVPVSLNHVPSS